MRQTRVRQLMTRDVITLDKGQSMPTAQELLRLLRIRHLPVVDREGKLVGLVTHRRLLQDHVNLLAQYGNDDEANPEDRIPVSRVMESKVHTVSPEQDAAEALELMLSEEVGCLPVVEEGRVVGIVTSKDFLTFQLRRLREEARRAAAGSDLDDDTATLPDTTIPETVRLAAEDATARDQSTEEDEPRTIPETPVAAAAVELPRDTAAPAAAEPPGQGRAVLTGIVCLGLGLGLGLLVERLVGRPAAPSASAPGTLDAGVQRPDGPVGADPERPAVGADPAPRGTVPDNAARPADSGAASSGQRQALSRPRQPDARPPAPDLRPRVPDLRPRAPDLRPPPRPNRGGTGWVPEMIRRR